MTTYLLPTAEIVEEFTQFEPMFYFYDDGVRGVIRDCVIYGADDDPETSPKEILLDAVSFAYDRACEIRYHENTHLSVDPYAYVEIVTEQIEYAVRQMMASIFVRMTYDLVSVFRDTNRIGWVGNDIYVKIKTLKQHHAAEYTNPRLYRGIKDL